MTYSPDLDRKPSPIDVMPAAQLRDLAAEMLEALERLYQEWAILACQCVGNDGNAGHPHCVVRKGLPFVDAAIQKARGL